MDLADTLWREFAVEADEHLHLIEQVLVHSTHAFTSAQVAQLFRSFHSLKGLGRTLGLSGIEATAHSAENILGVVRDGGATLDQALAECLLQSVDALRDLVQHANSTRSDAPPSGAVIALLEAAYAQLSGHDQPAPAAPPPQEQVALDEDPEMLVFFAESLAENLPILKGDDREAACEAAEIIAHGADMLGFAQLHENARAIAALMTEGGDDARLRRLLDDVQAQAQVVAEISGAELTLSPPSAAAPAPTQPLRAALAQDEPDSIAAAAREGFLWADAAGLPGLADLFLHMVDVCQRTGRGELELEASLRSWFLRVAELAEGGTDDGAEALAALLRTILTPEMPATGLPDEVAEILTPEQAGEIAEGVAAGLHVYAVLVFLEKHPAIAGRFVTWLKEHAHAVTNRTMLEDGETGFEFLLLSAHAPEDFRLHLLALDPTGACIRRAAALAGETRTPLISPDLRAAAATAAPEPATPRASAPEQSHGVIRVRNESIDELVRGIGETLLVANSIGAEASRITPGDLAALRHGVGNNPALSAMVDHIAESLAALRELHQRLDGAIGALHEQAIELRVVPLDSLFTRLLRAAREMAQAQGKAVACDAQGRDVRIDKTIVEQLAAPLTHMVRNAVDHGIETPDERAGTDKPASASFFLNAVQRGNEVCIQIGDDGRGLNDERILATAIKRGLITPGEADFLPRTEVHRLIFLPGFSTADQISETSGRGVGMDVVLTTVSALGGRIDIHSEPGRGTTFTIHLPLSAALQTALLVEADGQMLAVPERQLAEIGKVDAHSLRMMRGQACMDLRGSLLPLFSLSELLGLGPRKEAPEMPVLVIASAQGRIGIIVDRLHRRQELYMKDLHPRLAAIPGLGGASVLGDGQVILVLDGEGLVRRARQQSVRDPA